MESNQSKAYKGYALVTGGSGGIGYHLAREFAEDGYALILVARSQRGLDKAAEELRLEFPGTEVIPISTDLFDPQNAFALVDDLHARGLRVTALVNDAGQGLYGEFVDTDIHRELDIVQLNISSMLVLTKSFLQDMVSRKEGKILNLSSIAGKFPGPLQSVYHGTKSFIHSFTEALRSEVREYNVTVTSLLPGATDTDFFRKADMLDAKNVQSGDLADPAKVARDGYKALKNGKDMVVSGFMNKAQVALSNILPDDVAADIAHRQQAPVHQ